MKGVLMLLFFVIVCMNLLDAFTTQLIVANYGAAMESNPIARHAFESGGIKLVAYEVFKFVFFPVIVAVTISLMEKFRKTNPTGMYRLALHVATFTIIAAAAQLVLTVINNVSVAHDLGLMG